jgi:hypothetical protein
MVASPAARATADDGAVHDGARQGAGHSEPVGNRIIYSDPVYQIK